MPDNPDVLLRPQTPEWITLSQEGWEAFIAALDRPPKPNPALRALFEEFGPWPPPAEG